MRELLIVGGGAAGLSAGIFAQLNGMHATVCAQHTVAGGLPIAALSGKKAVLSLVG